MRSAPIAAQRVSIRISRRNGPAQFLQPQQERCLANLRFRIIRGKSMEHADAAHALSLLRARRQRPRRRRAAEQADELAVASCRAWAPSQVPLPIIAGWNRRAQAV